MTIARGNTAPAELRLLVRDLERSVSFQLEVLGGELVSRTSATACVRHGALDVLLVRDDECAYTGLRELVGLVVRRGAGLVVRIEVDEPEQHVERARQAGFVVFASCAATPSATASATASAARESLLADHDGYLWAVTVRR